MKNTTTINISKIMKNTILSILLLCLSAQLSAETSNDTIWIIRGNDTMTVANDLQSGASKDTLKMYCNGSSVTQKVLDSVYQTVLTATSPLIYDTIVDGTHLKVSLILADTNHVEVANKAKEVIDDYQKAVKHPFWSKDLGFLASWGPLSWSAMSNADDLFSGPSGDYALKFWSGQRWTLGFYTTFFPNNFLSLKVGLIYESDVFVFKHNVMWDAENNLVTSADRNCKSKIVSRYFAIPLILAVNLGNLWDSDFSLDLGLIGGLNFRTSSTGFKTRYNEADIHVEESFGTAFKDFKKLKLDAHFGVDFDGFQIYCEQALVPLFKQNTERKVYPFSFGIMISI